MPAVLAGAAAPWTAASDACPSPRFNLQWLSSAGTLVGVPQPTPSPTPSGWGTNQGYSSWTFTPTLLPSLVVSASASYSNTIPTNTSLAFRANTGGMTSGINFGWYGGTTYPGAQACFTISFNQPLCNLRFALTDIDWGPRENIYISSTVGTGTFTSVIGNTAAVAGSGTSADPWRSLVSGLNLPDTGSLDFNGTTYQASDGNVYVCFSGSVSSITFCTNSSGATASSFSENIALSSFYFDCPLTSTCGSPTSVCSTTLS